MLMPSILEDTNAIQEYLDGDTLETIGKRYGVSDTAVRNYLKKHNVPLLGRRYQSCSKYNFDIHWLDNLDSQEKFYFLGFFAADGNVDMSNGNYRARIKIQRGDRELLEKFNELLKSDREIEDGEEPNKYNKNGVEKYSIASYSSKPFCERLIELGLPSKKSLILKFPNYIPNEYLKDYVRGYFDGDGSITIIYSPKGTARATMGFAGSNYFIPKLSKILKKKLGIHSRCEPGHSDNYKYLNIDRIEDILKFTQWIYEDATIYLQRKYDRYIELISNRDITIEDSQAKHRRLIESLNEIKEKRKQGRSVTRIAEEYNTSKKTIYLLLKK